LHFGDKNCRGKRGHLHLRFSSDKNKVSQSDTVLRGHNFKRKEPVGGEVFDDLFLSFLFRIKVRDKLQQESRVFKKIRTTAPRLRWD
jgi:hypothetical protein